MKNSIFEMPTGMGLKILLVGLPGVKAFGTKKSLGSRISRGIEVIAMQPASDFAVTFISIEVSTTICWLIAFCERNIFAGSQEVIL